MEATFAAFVDKSRGVSLLELGFSDVGLDAVSVTDSTHMTMRAPLVQNHWPWPLHGTWASMHMAATMATAWPLRRCLHNTPCSDLPMQTNAMPT